MNSKRTLIATACFLSILSSCEHQAPKNPVSPEVVLIQKRELPELTLTSPDFDNKKIKVKTIEQWQSAVKKGYYARTNWQMKYEQEYQLKFDLQSLLVLRKQVTKPGAIVRLNDLTKLDATILPYMADWRNEERQGKTLAQYLKEHPHNILASTADELKFEFGKKEEYGIETFSFKVVMRADFTDDGYEDVVVRYAWHSGGSHSDSGVMLLSL